MMEKGETPQMAIERLELQVESWRPVLHAAIHLIGANVSRPEIYKTSGDSGKYELALALSKAGDTAKKALRFRQDLEREIAVLKTQLAQREAEIKRQHEDLWDQIKVFKDHNVQLYGDWAKAADQVDAAVKLLRARGDELCKLQCKWDGTSCSHTVVCSERMLAISDFEASPGQKLIEEARKILSGGYHQGSNGLVINRNQAEAWLQGHVNKPKDGQVLQSGPDGKGVWVDPPKKCDCPAGAPHTLFCPEYVAPPGVDH
jgi:hypothetical protein